MPTLVRDRAQAKPKSVDERGRARPSSTTSKSSRWSRWSRWSRSTSRPSAKPSRRERRAARKARRGADAEELSVAIAPTGDDGAPRRAVEIDDTTGRRTIDPRIKQRREAVLQTHRRRRLRRFFLFLFLVTLGIGGWFAAKSSLLAVQSVDVTAGPHTSAEEIRKAAAVRADLHMLDVDEAGIAQRIEALPWVDRATVERRWPRTLTISVTERAVRAVVPDGRGGWLTVDRTGRVLGSTPPVSHQFVPHIEGLAPVAPGQSMDPKIAGAVAVSSKLTVALAGRIASLHVTPEGTVDLKLNPRGTVWLGRAEEHLDEKVRSLQTMLAQADLQDMCRLDLRVPNSPVLTRDPVCA